MKVSAPVNISIVVPLHNEEGNVQALYDAVVQVIPHIPGPVEIVLVNDGSTDRTLELLEALAAKCDCVRVVDLEGNWGQAGAFCAGFEVARGGIILTMDGDLQNDPADFPRAIAKLQEGYRVVGGWRRDRQERYWDRVLPSRCANWLISLATGVPLHDVGCGLKAYRADVVKGKYLPRGFNRFMPAIFGVRRAEVAEIVVNDRKRHAGKTHYGLKRVFIVFKDLLAIPAILRSPSRHLRYLRWIQGVGLLGLLCTIFMAVQASTTGSLSHWLLWLFLAGFFNLLFVALSEMVLRNLRRFLDAQQTKGFRIRRVIEAP